MTDGTWRVLGYAEPQTDPLRGKVSCASNTRRGAASTENRDLTRQGKGVYLRSQYIPQVNISGRYSFGTQINFVPPKGEVPVSAKGTQGNLVVTLRPTSRLRNDNTYILSRLKSIRGRESIFTNHIIHFR